MANESSIILKIDFRTDSIEQGLSKAEKAAVKASKSVKQSFDASGKSIEGISVTANIAKSSFDGLLEASKKLLALTGTLTAGLAAVASVVKLIKIDEKNAQALREFEAAASASGVNATELANRLNAARNGLVGFEDVLKSSSKLLLELGANVGDKLPKLLELATKASVKFGIDTIDAYEKLTQAIVTGSTKQLASLGIYVNSSKAANEYARSIGLTVDQLTDAERRQATLNAVLAAGERSFSGVSVANRSVTSGLVELKVALTELVEAISSLLNSKLGDAFRSGISQVTQFAKNLKEALTPPRSEADRLREELNKINRAIFELQTQAESGPSLFDRLLSGFDKLSGNDRFAKSIEERIALLQDAKKRIISELASLSEEASRAQIDGTSKALSSVTEADLQAQTIILENRKKFALKLQELSDAERQARLQGLANTATGEERLRAQIELLELEHQKRLQAIRSEFALKRGITQADINLLIEKETARHNAQVEALNAQFYSSQAQQKTRFDEFVIQSTAATNQALVTIVSVTVQTLSSSLIQGGKAFGNFGATVLNIIGDLLINIGQAALAFGAVVDGIRASLISLFGGNAIVAGLAAIAIGGLLKAVASSMLGGGVKLGPLPTVTGGITQVGGSPAITPVVSGETLDERRDERVNTTPSVTINVEGSLFNTEETGRTLIDLLSREFNKRGARIVKRNFA